MSQKTSEHPIEKICSCGHSGFHHCGDGLYGEEDYPYTGHCTQCGCKHFTSKASKQTKDSKEENTKEAHNT